MTVYFKKVIAFGAYPVFKIQVKWQRTGKKTARFKVMPDC
jgi:hypothetical protein